MDDPPLLTFNHLSSHFYHRLESSNMVKKLADLLDYLDFHQVVIFVSNSSRAKQLNSVLINAMFPSMCIHGGLLQEERNNLFKQFKEYKKRILVCTDLFGHSFDTDDANVLIHYDIPSSIDQYLHRIGRMEGCDMRKCISIMFVSAEMDDEIFEDIRSKCPFNLQDLPEAIDPVLYVGSVEKYIVADSM